MKSNSRIIVLAEDARYSRCANATANFHQQVRLPAWWQEQFRKLYLYINDTESDCYPRFSYSR